MKKIYGFLTLLLLTALSVQAQDLTIRSDKKGRLGYFDEDGKEVIKCQFDEAEPFINGYARVLKGEDYGIINEKGKFVSGKYSVMTEYADTEYYLVAEGGSDIKPAKPGKEEKAGKTRYGVSARLFRGSMSFQIKGAKWGIIDREGREIVAVDYEEISSPIDGVIYVARGGKFGFFDENFHLIVKPTYSAMGSFNDKGITWVKIGGKPSGKMTAFSGNLSTATALRVANIAGATNINAHSWVGGKTGVIDKNGRVIVPVQYAYLGTFNPVTVSEDAELFSSQCPVPEGYIPFTELPSWDETYIWYANKLKAFFSNKWSFASYKYHYSTDLGLTDINGRKLIPEGRFSIVFRPTDGMMRFFIKGKKKKDPGTWGFYDLKTGHEYTTREDYEYTPFRNGMSRVKLSGGHDYCFVNKTMSEVSAHYEEAYDFNEGFCVVGSKGLYGMIDLSGREVVPPSYPWMSNRLSCGLVAAAKIKKVTSPAKDKGDKSNLVYGYIDCSGEVVIPFEYSTAKDFREGRAIVGRNGLVGIIDTKGQTVLPIEWESVRYSKTTGLNSDYFWVMQDRKYYFYDMQEQAVTFPEKNQGYNEAFVFTSQGLAIVRRGGNDDLKVTTNIGLSQQDIAQTDKGTLAKQISASFKMDTPIYESSGSFYGAVTRDGNELIPCQFEFTQIDAAWNFMKKNGLTQLRDVDIKRLRIILRGTSNTYPLSAVIPENEWDY